MILTYRVRATGQWCAASMEDEKIDTAAAAARADAVAATLGLAPGTLEPVVAPTDPRTGAMLAQPVPPTPPPPAMPEGYEPPLTYAERRALRALLGK